MNAKNASPAGFSAFRLDSHLILNTLNHFGMEVYTQLGRELPAIGLLADYLVAEHGIGQDLETTRGFHPLSAEWELCKSMLSLKASLVGTQLQFRQSGDLATVSVLDHSLATLLREVFAAWPRLAGQNVRLSLQVVDASTLLLSGHLAITAPETLREPFLAPAFEEQRIVAHDIGTVRVRADYGYAWDLDLQLASQR